MLKICGLTKIYGTFKAVDDLNITIEDGAIFGFVGPNGAGKTTTMKIIAGLLSPSSGSVVINDIDITESPKKLREKIGYMPDFFGVYDSLKVSEYLDFYAGAYAVPYKERGETLDNLLELVNLIDKRNEYVESLSRGMKQRLCLARSLIHDPEVLILDEPASGLDPRARVEMKEVLKQLSTLGKTIIISSHILPELAEMCTEIGIINGGKLVVQGSVNDIMRKMSSSRIISLKVLGKVQEAVRIISQFHSVPSILEGADTISFEFVGTDAEIALIIKSLVNEEIPLISFAEKEGNLESIFMELTSVEGGALND